MRRLFTVSALSLLVMTGCGTTSPRLNSPSSALVAESLVVSPNDDRQYQTMRLENGIDVLLISDPKVEKSAAALSVGVGLLHDPMTQQGMAHYLEHMLFLGTERYPDSKGYTNFMTNNGGTHNAYTWLDITNYMFKVNNDAYDEGLDRFSDFFKAPKLYPEYTDKEKNAVNAEWSMRREMDFFGQFKLARSMYGDHPANRFLIGNLETLGDKKNSSLHEETVAFYERYYSSNIMKVAMISNESTADMAKKAKKYFSTIKNKHIDKPEVSKSIEFSKVGKKLIHYVPNEDVKQLKIDFTIDNNSGDFAVKPNYFVTYLLSNEMAGGPAQVMKDKGWISSLTAYASPSMYGNYGSLTIDINVTDSGMDHRSDIISAVMQYIELIKKEGVNDKYFDEISTSLSNEFQFLEKGDEFSYVSSVADSMQKVPLNHVLNSDFYYAKFDATAVNNVLKQLTPERLRVWYISQQEPSDSDLHFYDGKYKISAITDDDIAQWYQPSDLNLELPTVNRLLPQNFDIKTTSEQARNGVSEVYKDERVTVWHAASERFAHQPKGSVDIFINTAEPLSNVKHAIAMQLWADLFSLQQSRLITEASVAGMSVGLAPGNGLILSVSGFTDKQPVLISHALKNIEISVNKTMFAQAVDRYRRGLMNAQKQFPFRQAFGQYSDMIRSGGFNLSQKLKALDEITVMDFIQLQRKTLTENNIRVFSYGNYSQEEVEAISTEINLALPEPKKVTSYTRSQYVLPKQGQILVWQEDITVADVAIVDMHVHPVPGYPQKAQGLVLQSHFRQHAFEVLRTEEQLAYAVGATAQSIDDYSAMGLYIQTPVNGVEKMQQRFEAFKIEYGQILTQLSEKTFTDLKTALLVSLKEEPKNLAEEFNPLINDWYRERYDYDSKDKLIKAVEQVSLEDVKAYYKNTMLNPDAARINVQMRGEKFADQPFATLPNQTVVKSLSVLYEQVDMQ
ncbi:insulinase family protein [Pseudoalteromonas aurantia]|uniref:Protease 3 n=1 Tax=Pseudoalteromonas aurantia TaxID=43654 RepID=A0ABY2VZ78_9GAMM|nr:insulinase family protein [Pseudoalteromonas aurantia]TMO75723.1 peptidase M16 [Pseudoalteromonas aurantia]